MTSARAIWENTTYRVLDFDPALAPKRPRRRQADQSDQARRLLDFARLFSPFCVVLHHKTYTIVKGPPPPREVDYLTRCRREWEQLLQSNPSESAVQRYMERNPVIIPGSRTPSGMSGHAPLYCAAISQPLLPGLDAKRPDFMWISKHSLTWFPTLIEIEAPTKRIFTKGGTPTAEFSQARNQLAEWRTWFSDPVNVQQFIRSYGIPTDFTFGRQMRLHMILVYGRRSEFEANQQLSKQRGSLLPGTDEELVSYDRIQPVPEMTDAITIRATGVGTYEAISVPPTFSLGPISHGRLAAVNDFEKALSKAPITKARRDFLLSRLPYWRNWSKNGSCGAIGPADWE